MPSKLPSHWLDYRRKRFWAIILVLVYVLAGFFAVPPILRGQTVSALQKALGRPVALDGAGFNPLTLGVDLRGLRITEKDGAPLAGFDRLHVRISLDSVVRRSWSVADIELDGLKADLIRDRDGSINIARLIPPPAAGPAPARDEGGVRLLVKHLKIKDAGITVTDRTMAEPFTTRIGPVNADIDRLGTLPDQTGKQHVVIDLEKGATLEWTNEFGLEPLHSSGHVTAKGPYAPLLLRYLGEALHLSAPTGSLDLALDYRLESRPNGGLGVAIDHLGVALSDLVLRETQEGAPLLSLPQFRLAGGHLAWPEREAGADSLEIDGLSVALQRQEDGRFALPALPASPASPDKAPQQAGPDWSVSLGKLAVKNAKGSFEDHSLHETGKVDISSLDLSAESLSAKPGAAFPFSLSAGLAQGGSVKMQGKLTALPALTMDAKLAVSDLPIAIAQPYLHDVARLGIGDGKIEAEGDVKLAPPDGLKIVGQAELRSLKLDDEVEKRPVLSWDSLTIDRYSYYQSANELRVSQVTLNSPFARFQVAADHSTNLAHVMVPAAPPKPQAAPASPAAPVKISVGRINVAKGSADYGDASLPLPFATHITNLQGHISGLSSTAQSASGISLQGQVDQYGEVNIFGRVNPFQIGKAMKINVVFRNVDFPGLSPYTMKFAGRRIAKGHLDLDSRYAIDDGTLNGSNKLVIRDMELGERVDVPGAMDLPLDLAISLLKDDEGKINLDLPVSGNVNDPHFDFGGVVTKAIADVLGDLVTAPFRALAGLFGGDGEALDHIDFMPGRSDLEPPEKEKIRHVAEILKKRPKLGVSVSGVVDPQADRQRLQRDGLDAEMAKELGDHDTLSHQRRFLESLYEKRIGSDQLAGVRKAAGVSGGALDDPGYIAELRRQVAKTEPLDQASLTALSQARGKAVADALNDPQRVTLSGGKEAKAGDDGRIPLKLEAAER